eukprot:5471391-Pyramimonas_sp.AAC.1
MRDAQSRARPMGRGRRGHSTLGSWPLDQGFARDAPPQPPHSGFSRHGHGQGEADGRGCAPALGCSEWRLAGAALAALVQRLPEVPM